MLRSAAATITSTVRAWLAVRASAAYLVSVAGHFTRNELVKTAVTRSQRDSIPLTVLKAAADKFLDRPLLNRLVEVGTRGKEEVWTARGHERAERKFLRDSAALARSRGRGLKSSAVHEAARHLNKHGEQLVTAFRGVTHRRSQLGLLSTPSGEDKTRVLNAVCEAYERSGFRVRLTAPTGVAVDSLKNETKRPAKTTAWLLADVSRMPIIKVLGWMHKQSAFNLPAKLKGAETVRRPFDPLTKKDVVVLDSAHLLGTREGQRLAASCRKAGAKLILVGDHFRSAGVVAGGGWRELTARHRAFAIPVPKPQAESPERKAAYEVRAGNPYKAAETLRGAGRVHSGRGSVAALLKRYRDNDGLIEPARHLIVVGRDREAAAINKTVQRERRDAGLLGLASVRVGPEKRTSVRAGDRVMFTRSSVTLGVQTGRTGTVISVNPLLKTVTVRQDRGGDLTVRTSTFPHLALAYAANIRRSPSIAVANYYALVAGRGYSGPSMVTLLEQASERVQFFLAARHASLARILSQADPKKLATTHRPGQDRPLQEQQSTQSQSQNVSP